MTALVMGSTQTNILLYFILFKFILLKELIKKVARLQVSLPILVGLFVLLSFRLWSLQIVAMLLFLLWKCLTF